MSLDIIRVENLSFRYNAVDILSEVSFSLKAGDYLGLVGPNGSGKTTLLKTLLNILKPASGMISLFGRPIGAFRHWRKIGFLPQKTDASNPQFPATVSEVVGMGFLGTANRERKRAVESALSLLDMALLKDRLIGELSGGQKQRALIARSIVNEPELLILDEPATALDPETRDNFFTFLKDLNQRLKVTIILVTHDMGSIGKYASKLLYLDRKPLFFGSFDDFCRSETMTSLFGASSQHIICQRHGNRGAYGNL